jgi:hypothetical protein
MPHIRAAHVEKRTPTPVTYLNDPQLPIATEIEKSIQKIFSMRRGAIVTSAKAELPGPNNLPSA